MRPPPKVSFDHEDSEQVSEVFSRFAAQINEATAWMAEAIALIEEREEDGTISEEAGGY